MKRINSNDIAKFAGVSRSTVSRVINGYSNVPEETRRKVMKVIKEYHYYPQLSGQLLNGQRTKTIGLFWGTSGAIAKDPLCSSYFMHAIDAAAARGYLVLSCVLNNLTDRHNIDYVRKIFMEGRIDAGIFIGANNNEPLVEELVDADMIVGLFDYYHSNEDKPNRITSNFDVDSGEMAIDYLYNLGHRKIAVVDGDLGRISSLHRHSSYLKGFAKHNLPIKHKWMTYGGIVEQEGYKAAKQMLESCMDDLPTAICANNDSVAFGVMQACQDLGIRVPEDISVIGIDGHANGAFTNPPLTTITFDFQEMFSSLVDRLVDAIEQQENVPQNAFSDGHLLERASCREIQPE